MAEAQPNDQNEVGNEMVNYQNQDAMDDATVSTDLEGVESQAQGDGQGETIFHDASDNTSQNRVSPPIQFDPLSKDYRRVIAFARELNLSKKDALELAQSELTRLQQIRERKEEKESAQLKEIQRLNLEIEKQKEKMSKEMTKHDQKEKDKDQKTGKNEPIIPKSALSHLKLPLFDEKTTDIETFIFRFEKHAELCGWPKEIWCQALASRLTGEALEVFRDVSVEKATTFETLKENLFTHFHLTEEGFNQRFRESRHKQGETFTTFTDRLKRNFNRWTQSAKIEKSYEKMVDLILREQVYATSSKELLAFLKEEGCKDLNEVATKAERFRLAHPSKQLCSKQLSSESLFHTGFAQTKTDEATGQGKKKFDKKRFNKGNDDKGQKEGKKDDFSCFICGADNHVARGCRLRKKKEERTPKNDTASASAKLCIPLKPCDVCGSETKLIRDCQHNIDKVSAATKANDCLSTCQGEVNGEKVNVLLDTGCSTVGVHKRLVKENQLTGRNRSCVGFGGEILSYPIANVYLDTPYFKGDVDVCVLENPSYDVILGKFRGCSLSVSGEEHLVNTVTTRQQARTQRGGTKPLKVGETPLLVSREELIRLQKEDDTLDLDREKAINGEKFPKKNAIVHFELQDEILV